MKARGAARRFGRQVSIDGPVQPDPADISGSGSMAAIVSISSPVWAYRRLVAHFLALSGQPRSNFIRCAASSRIV